MGHVTQGTARLPGAGDSQDKQLWDIQSPFRSRGAGGEGILWATEIQT